MKITFKNVFIDENSVVYLRNGNTMKPVGGLYHIGGINYTGQEIAELYQNSSRAKTEAKCETVEIPVIETRKEQIEHAKPPIETRKREVKAIEHAKVAHEKSKRVKPLRTKVNDAHEIDSKDGVAKPSKHSGESNSKFKGYYLVNGVQYPSSRIASQVTGIPARTIQSRCKAVQSGFSGFSFITSK